MKNINGIFYLVALMIGLPNFAYSTEDDQLDRARGSERSTEVNTANIPSGPVVPSEGDDQLDREKGTEAHWWRRYDYSPCSFYPSYGYSAPVPYYHQPDYYHHHQPYHHQHPYHHHQPDYWTPSYHHQPYHWTPSYHHQPYAYYPNYGYGFNNCYWGF